MRRILLVLSLLAVIAMVLAGNGHARVRCRAR
jgi:hypothetical protein